MIVDFHSHVLPGIDDGSPDPGTSIAMLRMAAAQGVTHVVATPHFYPRHDDPLRFLERRDRAEQILRAEMEKHDGLPQLLVGAEVGFFRGISDSELLTRLTIRGKRCILIEMPHAPWPEEYFRELEAIWVKRNIWPIVAHIDRYIGPFRTFGIPAGLARLPVYVQVNAEAFLDRGMAGLALRMLKNGQIHLLGSDCHDMDERKPNLGPAAEKIRRRLGEEMLREVRDQSRRLLEL